MMSQDVIAHLSMDNVMKDVVQKVELRIPKPNRDIYFVLLRSIVEQQLSTKAAATIWQRFLNKVEAYPAPELLLDFADDELRACGLSYQKVGYLKNIAHFSINDELSFKALSEMTDAELINHLSQIKGVGKWTAEMVMMFAMGRSDVLPLDDLIIRNAMVKLYDVTSEKRQLYRDLEELAEPWRPYRSFGCFLLWDWYEGEVLERPLYGS